MSTLKTATAFSIALAITMILLGLVLGGCLHPVPPPVPGPTPTSPDAASPDVAPADAMPDPFKNQDFDCHLPIVASQYTAASPPVGRCLGTCLMPLTCLERLIGTYDINTIACVARDLGSGAVSAALAGTDAGNGVCSTTIQTFINAEHLGFQ